MLPFDLAASPATISPADIRIYLKSRRGPIARRQNRLYHQMARSCPRPEWHRWWLRWIQLTGPFLSEIQSRGRCPLGASLRRLHRRSALPPKLVSAGCTPSTRRTPKSSQKVLRCSSPMGCGDNAVTSRLAPIRLAPNAILTDCLQSRYGISVMRKEQSSECD